MPDRENCWSRNSVQVGSGRRLRRDVDGLVQRGRRCTAEVRIAAIGCGDVVLARSEAGYAAQHGLVRAIHGDRARVGLRRVVEEVHRAAGRAGAGSRNMHGRSRAISTSPDVDGLLEEQGSGWL